MCFWAHYFCIHVMQQCSWCTACSSAQTVWLWDRHHDDGIKPKGQVFFYFFFKFSSYFLIFNLVCLFLSCHLLFHQPCVCVCVGHIEDSWCTPAQCELSTGEDGGSVVHSCPHKHAHILMLLTQEEERKWKEREGVKERKVYLCICEKFCVCVCVCIH